MTYGLSNSEKYITVFHLKITIFTDVKYRSILHMRVIAMKDHSGSRAFGQFLNLKKSA